MPSAVRRLLVLTVLLSAGAAAVAAGPSAHGPGADSVGTVAASLLDTSWGDHYTPHRQ
ncbi:MULTISPECIES: hypothetical protein [unclassified Streptomyces]|jgi:hypothetical protein|uniref:hypothetical protein n=1 Tax=unclassified Streptomyces TaxID=2593676 RepID=UPI00081B07C7|nr:MULTISPECIES: hypothetical protein [unclassified Streptomyces]MEE1743217.1 hypothetical protein [Streptomyces sp. JV184]MYQ83376.1 hypothetical protein [Streptomyces sp. SID4936]SCD65260.1 hypothetical protein GA0115234_1041186 [Streptomyces sp. DvalAA-43]